MADERVISTLPGRTGLCLCRQEGNSVRPIARFTRGEESAKEFVAWAVRAGATYTDMTGKEKGQMAYFGRQPQKPQQRGRIEGGVTKPGSPTRGERVAFARSVLRSIKEERPGRPTRVTRTLRTARAIRAGRTAR